jgi:hypothetical protein
MTQHSKAIAHEVHELLLAASPETDNVNLIKAAHLAETAGVPRERFQLNTFVAIRNLRTAIENGASAAELEPLLLHAISLAAQWATVAWTA